MNNSVSVSAYQNVRDVENGQEPVVLRGGKLEIFTHTSNSRVSERPLSELGDTLRINVRSFSPYVASVQEGEKI